jgi:cytoplasmic FMR1 interacting protein
LCFNRYEEKKLIRRDKIGRILKNLEVVPLLGDMQIAPFNYIKRSKNYEASRWPLCGAPSSSSPQADLMVHLPQIREDHVKFTSELARYSKEVLSFSLNMLVDYSNVFCAL